MMPNLVLITGGAGFIGSRLALKLVARGHRVTVLDSLSPQIHGEVPENSKLYRSILGRVEFIRGDVRCRDDLSRALSGVDTVVHLAAETGTGQSMYAIQHYSDVNVGGTSLFLDLIANTPFTVRKLVVASSRAIYGEGKYRCPDHGAVYPKGRLTQDMSEGHFDPRCPVCGQWTSVLPSDEDTPSQPTSIYGITKLNQEQMVLTVAKALGISGIAYRYQNVYGPGQSLSNPYTGILSIFSARIRHGKAINIFEDGRESRDFVYVDDVVDATVRGIEYEVPLVDVFNVGSGVATDVLTVAETLQRLYERQVPTEISGQFRLGDIRHNYANLAKVTSVLGFSPTVPFDEGLQRFASWVGNEQLQVDRYDESLRELREKGLFK
jgi:dTDP-L-rhamnose 4-epimerase